MKTPAKVLIMVALMVAVAAVVAAKYYNNSSGDDTGVSAGSTDESKEPRKAAIPDVNGSGAAAGLPRLVELGSDKCIPCRTMAPIIDELRDEYAGRLQVDFFDVWKDPTVGEHYNIRVIPTQIFFDPSGKELFRHVGVFSKADILAKWRQFGFDFEKDNQ